MNEKKKTGSKGVVMTLGIAAMMIALCAILMNTVLAHAAQPAENEIHTDPIVQTLGTSMAEPAPQEDLNILVYNNGLTPPADGITAQYAVAVTSEIAERVYGKEVSGRVFVALLDNQGYETDGRPENLFWEVQAEVDGGLVRCNVNAVNGTDDWTNIVETAVDWTWFDTWNEEAAEQERLENEQLTQELIERDEQLFAQQPQPTAEEAAAANEIKRQGMLDFIALMADTPYGEKAVELVNTLGIGDGATAVSGTVVMGDGDSGSCNLYLVEVQLDNGIYVILRLAHESMKLLSYERHDMTLAQILYG